MAGTFTKLVEHWSELTDDEKIASFLTTNHKTAELEELKKIGKFKILKYSQMSGV